LVGDQTGAFVAGKCFRFERGTPTEAKVCAAKNLQCRIDGNGTIEILKKIRNKMRKL
jgi:hypothetical protein